MCILFIAIDQHPRYPLIIAANRDEFYARPTQHSHFWFDHPKVLAGRDLQQGGTWMGVNKSGKLAALTNIRAPHKEHPDPITRGELVSRFLLESSSNDDYLKQLRSTKHRYNGYNLLFGDIHNLSVYNNFTDEIKHLSAGIYGLSNANLDTPWPKINTGKDALATYCKNAEVLSAEHLFQLLQNTTQAEGEMLPNTGIPKDWEQQLSSIFIHTETYGTRSSTLLFIDNTGHVEWRERMFNTHAKVTQDVLHEFDIRL